MKKPKMIIFDYGQTLVNERKFDGLKGTAAVMEYAVENKYGRTPEQIQAEANALNKELGRFEPEKRHLFQVEIPQTLFSAYLYESQGVKLSIPYSKIEQIFWDAASPGVPTEGMEEFLQFLKEKEIRTAVISNISYSGAALTDRINRLLPNNEFEFIIASSEYIFRKPNHRIFELALEKAGLEADEVWYIGDQYECDIKGAGQAGMFPVWYTAAIDFAQDMEQEAMKVNSWTELMEYINKIGQ